MVTVHTHAVGNVVPVLKLPKPPAAGNEADGGLKLNVHIAGIVVVVDELVVDEGIVVGTELVVGAEVVVATEVVVDDVVPGFSGTLVVAAVVGGAVVVLESGGTLDVVVEVELDIVEVETGDGAVPPPHPVQRAISSNGTNLDVFGFICTTRSPALTAACYKTSSDDSSCVARIPSRSLADTRPVSVDGHVVKSSWMSSRS